MVYVRRNLHESATSCRLVSMSVASVALLLFSAVFDRMLPTSVVDGAFLPHPPPSRASRLGTTGPRRRRRGGDGGGPSSPPTSCVVAGNDFLARRSVDARDRSSSVRSKNDDDDDDDETLRRRTRWGVDDVGLLAGDLLSLLVVAQLLGLADVLVDPGFWSRGGLAQPVPAIPSTLGTLVRRASETDAAWVFAGLKQRGYDVSSVADDSSAARCAFWTWLDHCSLRILFALVTAWADATPVDGYDLLRQFWFALPVMMAFRVAYGRRLAGRL